MTDSGITWTDVRATIPQPYQAHDAEHGVRRVEARFTIALDADPAYQLQFRLLVNGTPVETWTRGFVRSSIAISSATNAYVGARMDAEEWLLGRRIVRPNKWKITKGTP